jgi:hypothetical protein
VRPTTLAVESATNPANLIVHDVGPEHVLGAAENRPPLVQKLVPEDQRHPLPGRDHPILHRSFAASEIVVQIQDARQLALFTVLAPERAVAMQGKFLSGPVAILAKPFIETDHLAAVEKSRDVITDARSDERAKAVVVNNDALVVADVFIDPGALERDDGSGLIADLFGACDVLAAFGGQRISGIVRMLSRGRMVVAMARALRPQLLRRNCREP